MIRKRTVVALCACVFSSLLTFAQTASQRSYRIGLLSDTTYFSEHATALQWDAGEQLAGLRQGMKDLGVVEGKDWILIPRIANRDHALLDKYAAELAEMKVDVIAVSSTTAALAARKVTNTIPIVGWGSLDGAVPAGAGTNVAGFRPPPVSEYLKQLRAFMPNLQRLGVLYDVSYATVPPMFEELKRVAAAEHLELLPVEVGDNDDIAPVFDKMAEEHAQAVIVLNHHKFLVEREKLAALELQHHLPVVGPYRDTAQAGLLMAHHPDWEKVWHRAAKMIQQVLAGTPPGQIPVETGDMRYYINVKTANALGLTIPDSLRAKAELIGGVNKGGSESDRSADRSTDEAAIRAIIADNTQAFNRQDPAGTVAHRTEDFDHINVAGVWTARKDQLQKGMTDYFKTRHPTMTTSVEKIRFLTPDVAYAIVKRQYKDEKGTRDAISTSVFQKINGQWWDAAFQNTLIQPSAQQPSSDRQEPASVEQEIKQLEEERRQAVLHQDVEKLKRFYADGMTIIDIDGDFHVNANNASPNLNQPATRTTLRWIIDDIAVKPYGPSAAIVTMRAETEDVLKGIHRNFIQRLMQFWVKRNGQWQIVARHGTEIATAPVSSAALQRPVNDLPHETEIQKPAALTPEQQEIFDFHRKLHEAHWRGDTATLKQLLTTDWFVARPSGQIVTREQFLSSVKPGEPPRLQDEISIRTFGEVAVMTLRTTWSDGRVQRGTEVFVRENGAWKQAANQQTLVRTSASSKPAASAASTTGFDPLRLTPEDYSVLLENDRVRVLDWHMQPDAREPMHSHPDNVVYTFDEYKLGLRTAHGKSTELTSKPGMAFLMKATMHSPENIGTTQAHALQVELKQEPTPAPPSGDPAPSATGQTAPAHPVASADENEIAQLEDQCLLATLHGDTDFPEKYFAENYTQIALGGNLTGKADQIRFRKTGAISYEALDLKDRTIRIYGEVAVVVMHSYAKYTANGRLIEGDFRATRVWHRQNGEWKIVAFQTNKVSDTGGPATSDDSAGIQREEVTPADGRTNEMQVRDALAAFVAAFNARDRARLNQLRTPDMDRRSNQNGEILMLGDQSRGTPVMNNPSDNQQWTRTVDKMRFLTPDVAIVDTHGDETRTNTKTGEHAVRHVFNTYVMTRGSDGAWRVAASRY